MIYCGTLRMAHLPLGGPQGSRSALEEAVILRVNTKAAGDANVGRETLSARRATRQRAVESTMFVQRRAAPAATHLRELTEHGTGRAS